MRPTLGLDDDLDPVALQEAVEAAFGMRFSDAEAAACRTVGDVLDAVRRRFPVSGEDDGRCGTAMAFHRLRRGLADLHPERPLRPGTRLEHSRLPPRRLLRAVGAASGLRLPRGRASRLGQAGLWLILGGLAVLVVSGVAVPQAWPGGLALVVAGAALVHLDPGGCRRDARGSAGSRSLRPA